MVTLRLCYILLSPTWGMHQYTADLANRMSAVGHEVHLITTRRVPRDRYVPEVEIHTPFETTDRGFSPRGLRSTPSAVRAALSTIHQVRPDVVHITGAHLGNPWLLRALRRQGLPTVHTLHDLHPHAGSTYGRLLYAWNAWVRREASHLLVHGERYRAELIRAGVAPLRVTCTLLTHLFVNAQRQQALEQSPPEVEYEPRALFIGRLEAYKGLDVLVEAVRRLEDCGVGVIIAGQGRLEEHVRGPLPGNVQLRSGLVGDDEAVELFRRCGVVVLPYVEASQSALPAAAYFFSKPVLVTRVGALPEYVVDGETGRVVPPGDCRELAEALATVLTDTARLVQLGCAGHAWYVQQRQADSAALQAMYARVAGRDQP